MDRRAELSSLYQQALRLGEELLVTLREAVTDEGLARVEQLLAERAAVAERTTELFAPELQPEFQGELKALVEQQRALEAQMAKVQADLLAQSQKVRETRSTMEGVRKTLKTQTRSRWVNEKV
ncbi:MAG: hypothetical protein ACOY93_01795 [Bacillota bacterium]